MPRKKAEKKIEEPKPEHETPVVYEGAEVISILEQKETAYHCNMSDGTTKWIPKAIFEKKL